MKSPVWSLNRIPPWGCTHGEHARLNGFLLTVRVWANGLTQAKLEYRGGPAGGWTDAAQSFRWPRVDGKDEVTRQFAREWCEREARKRPKARIAS